MSEDDVRNAWKDQFIEHTFRVNARDMEKRMRRGVFDLYAVAILGSLALGALAAVFRNPLMIAGAVLLAGGLTFLARELRGRRETMPPLETAALDYHRALLERQLDFHRKRIWLRVAALAPGGILFFLGFAAARPDLATFIYIQLATFVVAIALIVPLNRVAAARTRRAIEELTALRSP
jgi:hypothetical protein